METAYKDSILSICEDVATPDQVIVLETGDQLINSGNLSDKVYIIREGLFKLCVGYGGMSLTVDFLLPGYVTGLVNLYQPTKYPCSITSLNKSVVYEWDRKKILELMSLMPEVNKEIRRSYSGWGTRVVERIKCLVFYSPEQRVVSWILDYDANSLFHGSNLWKHLSDKEMAAFCNLPVDELRYHLNKLQKLGFIQLDVYAGCVVLNKQALLNLLNF